MTANRRGALKSDDGRMKRLSMCSSPLHFTASSAIFHTLKEKGCTLFIYFSSWRFL